jgi:hypothetical protein
LSSTFLLLPSLTCVVAPPPPDVDLIGSAMLDVTSVVGAVRLVDNGAVGVGRVDCVADVDALVVP